jgi:hypothetical protein
VAKNRYGLPDELPLSWPALMDALAGSPMPAAGVVPARGETSATTNAEHDTRPERT